MLVRQFAAFIFSYWDKLISPKLINEMTIFSPVAEGFVVELGQINYLIRKRIEFEIPADALTLPEATYPAVVVNAQNDDVSAEFIQHEYERFDASDDVFSKDFTINSYLILQRLTPGSSQKIVEHNLGPFLRNNLQRVLVLNSTLPEGPYLVQGQRIHQGWRLYRDELSAFARAVIPRDEETAGASGDTQPRFQAFDSASHVPVPSRLYFQRTKQYPLSGVRISIKDNMHLAGVVTGLGNKAYAQLYGQRESTSAYVTSLIKRGAIIVGKTKLSAFAGSEIPPNQCIDYFPPWNPRGDGYQGPSGSSSGAGASIAGYPWLDASLCTDTGGSVRHPASSHGVWGHRVSWNTLPMENIVPATPLHDSIGLLSRDPEQLQDLLEPGSFDRSSKPSRLIYPIDWYPTSNAGQQKMNELFLTALESSLGIKHTKLSLKEEWARTAPVELRSTALEEYLDKSGGIVGAYHVYHTFDDFRREYPAKFGKKPYVSPAHTARWERGAKITEQEYQQNLNVTTVFRRWFEKTIWRSDDSTGTGPTIFIVPQGRPGANYRDTVGAPATGAFGNSYNPITVTCILGCPQLVVPVGQNPYESRVSENIEYAPIFSSLIGPPKSDALLVDIARNALEKARWPTTVLTGPLMFTRGSNERNSDLAPSERL